MVSFQQNSNRSKQNPSKKDSITLLITSGNSAKPFEFLEKAFDHMASLIRMPVTEPWPYRVAFRRDGVFAVFPLDIVKNLIRSICLVSKNVAFGQFKARQKFHSHSGVIDISRCKQKFKRIPQCVCEGMNFRVQTAFCTSYGLGLPFFTPPLALSCTLTEVESIQMYSISASRFSSRNIFSKTPSFCHLRNRAYTLCQLP